MLWRSTEVWLLVNTVNRRAKHRNGHKHQHINTPTRRPEAANTVAEQPRTSASCLQCGRTAVWVHSSVASRAAACNSRLEVLHLGPGATESSGQADPTAGWWLPAGWEGAAGRTGPHLPRRKVRQRVRVLTASPESLETAYPTLPIPSRPIADERSKGLFIARSLCTSPSLSLCHCIITALRTCLAYVTRLPSHARVFLPCAFPCLRPRAFHIRLRSTTPHAAQPIGQEHALTTPAPSPLARIRHPPTSTALLHPLPVHGVPPVVRCCLLRWIPGTKLTRRRRQPTPPSTPPPPPPRRALTSSKISRIHPTLSTLLHPLQRYRYCASISLCECPPCPRSCHNTPARLYHLLVSPSRTDTGHRFTAARRRQTPFPRTLFHLPWTTDIPQFARAAPCTFPLPRTPTATAWKAPNSRTCNSSAAPSRARPPNHRASSCATPIHPARPSRPSPSRAPSAQSRPSPPPPPRSIRSHHLAPVPRRRSSHCVAQRPFARHRARATAIPRARAVAPWPSHPTLATRRPLHLVKLRDRRTRLSAG